MEAQPVVQSFTPTSGSADSIISISGKFFTGTTAVQFGQLQARSFTVLNDSTISAVVDVGYTGNIRVYNPNGFGVSPGIFTYLRKPPVITDLSAVQGKAGDVIQITGQNFDADTGKIIVKFGAGIAQVVAASPTTLTAIIPDNTTHDFVSVIRNSGTGYSPVPFSLTFNGSAGFFSANTFMQVLERSTGYGPSSLAVADIKKDKRSDLAVVNSLSGQISFYNNKTTNDIEFDNAITRNLTVGAQGIEATDFGSLGNADFLVGNTTANGIFRAQYIEMGPNAPYFAGNVPLPTKTFASQTNDLNNDGTLDWVVIGRQSGANGVVRVLRNESAGNFGSFQNLIGLSTHQFPSDLLLADLDNDRKPEIMVSDSVNGLAIFRNISTATIAFETTMTSVLGNTNIQAITAVDFNKDGKIDILAVGKNNNLRLFLNTTPTGGSISFTVHEISIPSTGFDLAVADIDGDGNLDVCTFSYSNQLTLLHGNGQIPSLFDSHYVLTVSHDVRDLVFADLDNDSKPEMITASYEQSKIFVYRNQVGEAVKFALCSGQQGSLTGDVTGSNYQWQLNTGSGYVNITDDVFYGGSNSQTLTLKQTQGSWYGYKYRLIADAKTSNEYVLKFENTFTPAGYNEWDNLNYWSCGTAPDEHTDVIVTGGTLIVNTNAIIRSLKVSQGAQIVIATGASLTVLH